MVTLIYKKESCKSDRFIVVELFVASSNNVPSFFSERSWSCKPRLWRERLNNAFKKEIKLWKKATLNCSKLFICVQNDFIENDNFGNAHVEAVCVICRFSRLFKEKKHVSKKMPPTRYEPESSWPWPKSFAMGLVYTCTKNIRVDMKHPHKNSDGWQVLEEGLQVISCQAVAYGNACKNWIQKVSEHDEHDCFDQLQGVVLLRTINDTAAV